MSDDAEMAHVEKAIPRGWESLDPHPKMATWIVRERRNMFLGGHLVRFQFCHEYVR